MNIEICNQCLAGIAGFSAERTDISDDVVGVFIWGKRHSFFIKNFCCQRMYISKKHWRGLQNVGSTHDKAPYSVWYNEKSVRLLNKYGTIVKNCPCYLEHCLIEWNKK